MTPENIVDAIRGSDSEKSREALQALFPDGQAILIVNEEDGDRVVNTGKMIPSRMFGPLVVCTTKVASSLGLELNWFQNQMEEESSSKIQIVPGGALD